MKREQIGPMLIRKPDGECIQREIKIVFDDSHGGSFEIEVVGESPLKDYSFTVMQKTLKSVRDTGTPIA
jgi:hypothetical protein